MQVYGANPFFITVYLLPLFLQIYLDENETKTSPTYARRAVRQINNTFCLSRHTYAARHRHHHYSRYMNYLLAKEIYQYTNGSD